MAVKRLAFEERSWISHAAEFIGWAVLCLGVVFLAVTIVTVWFDVSSLNELRHDFYDTNRDAAVAKSRTEALWTRMEVLEAAWNKEHPDSKLMPPPISFGNGAICDSRGCR